MTSIKRDQIYGDFKAVDRLNADRGLFRCECVYCGTSRRFLAPDLLRLPPHDCPDAVKAANVKVEVGGRSISMGEIADGLADGMEDDDEEFISRFAEEVENINALISELERDTNNLTGDRKFQMVMLKVLVDVIPVAERAYRKDPRQGQAMAMNAMISQVRELFQDLQAEEDRGDLAMRVLMNILQPAFLQMGQILIDGLMGMRGQIENKIKPDQVKRVEELVNATMLDMGKSYQGIFFDIKRKVAEELG